MTESGGSDMGMAGAGAAATAFDGSVLEANPAGMARLPGTTITVAAVPALVQLDFKGSATTPGSAHNHEGPKLTGSAFAVQSFSGLSLGLGLYSYTGLGADFGDEWVGRRVIEHEQLRSLNIAPAVAYQVTDHLQFGGTLRAQYVEVEASLAVNNSAALYGPPAGLPDGQVSLQGHSWSPGGDLGIAYQPRPDVELGLAWTSAVHHTVDFDVTAAGLHPVLGAILPQALPVSLSLTLPQQVAASGAWQATPATTLAATARWQEWSTLGEARQMSGLGDRPMFPQGLRDTWGASLGVRHRLPDGTRLSAGMAYDSDPSREGTMPAYFPSSSQLRLALGGEWPAREDLTVRLALSVIQQGEVRVAQLGHPLPLPGVGPLSGTFPASRFYFAALAVDFRR